MAWQPIETAPRGANGIAFMQLAWGPGDDQTTGNGMRYGDKFFAAAIFYQAGQDRKYGFREIEVNPTHWKAKDVTPEEEAHNAKITGPL